jgi:hypothetical protein
MRYVHLTPSHMTPLTLARVRDAVRGARVCGDCVHYADAAAEVHVVVQERSAGRHGLNFVQGCSVGVAKRKLLDALASEVVSQLFIGGVHSETGRELTELLTFRAQCSVVVRGEKHASYRCCASCGRLCYFAMGRSYLYPAPPADVPVFDSGLGGLVIRADCFRSDSFPKFTGIRIDNLDVALEPLDGFAEIRPNKAPEPTRSAVTPRADARVAPAARVAHLYNNPSISRNSSKISGG